MKCHINLLPWRLKQHQQNSRILLLKLLGLMSIVLILSFGLHYFDRQISMNLTEKRTDLQQIITELTKIERQIAKLRNSHNNRENQTPVTTEKILQILTLLSELPLQDGELDSLTLNSTQIELSGITENQPEFEGVNRFLSESPLFQRVILSGFTPHQDGSLQFKFMLDLAGE